MKISVISDDRTFARMLETELSWRSHVIVSDPAEAELFLVDSDTHGTEYSRAIYFGRGERPHFAERFLHRPFRMTELFSLVEADERTHDIPIAAEPSEIRLEKDRCVQVGGLLVPLSDAEYALLALLLDRRGETVTKDEIVSQIFPDAEKGSNVCEVYIHYLREKLEKPLDTKLIRTVRGQGYMIK